ncbi:hypothetical protein LguiB_007710 [Lonicera macranthoides]
MANNVQVPRMKQMGRHNDRQILSSSDDNAMMKQIDATHSPDGREVDVKPVLFLIEEILHRTIPDIDGFINGTDDHIDTLDDKAIVAGFDEILEVLAYIIHKISCELSCKCSGGADAHSSTMTILSMLSSHKWEAKVVISLAAFTVNYGEFWLVAQLCPTNPLAKSVALLKQLPDIIEHSYSLKSRFDTINNLIKAILDVTKCIIEFKQLPAQYISEETPPLSLAIAHIPIAAYWTIRSMVVCASQITSLLGMSYEHITATTEAWELSSLAHKVRNIHEHLKGQLTLCYQHIDEKRHDEYFNMLLRLFEMQHLDNLRILKALIYNKDDILPLLDGTSKTRVPVDALRRKNVLLLISDLDLSTEELTILVHIYQESRTIPDIQYAVVWIPIVDRTIPWIEGYQKKFEQLQSEMPWYSVHHPSLLEPAVTKYIKEVWHFAKKQILVVVDPHGKLACLNAFHMVWIWRNLAYPFTISREEGLWKEETWRLELLVDDIDTTILDWIAKEKYVCLYGGEDIEWIRRFTTTLRDVAETAGIGLEMVYVGKSKSRERMRRIISTISVEKLSHTWTDLTFIWYFWTRIESMLYSKMQQGKTIENDPIMQEVMAMLSFDGSDQGWALISRGLSAVVAKAKGDTILKSLTDFEKWQESAKQNGFVQGLIEYLHKLHTPEHCNRLILPGINGGIPEMVVCAECGRPMEKYFMYRCCTD